MTRPPAPSLAQRLQLASAVLIAALLVVAGVLWTMLQQVTTHATHVHDNRAPLLQRIAELELNVTRAALQLRHAILARNPQEQEAALADVMAKKHLLEERIQAFGKAKVTEAGKKAFEPLPALMQSFWQVGADHM